MTMEQCWIGLGGNLGDVPTTFAAVADQVSRQSGCADVVRAPLYRSAAMGQRAGDTFWNSVIGCQTTLEPLDLLHLLQELETTLGRVRTIHWGPRTVDLDLLYYGQAQLQTTELTIPHPGRAFRRFVLDPLCAIAGDWLDPQYALTARQLCERLVAPPRRLTLPGDLPPEVATQVAAAVQRRWPDVVCQPRIAAETPHGLVVAWSDSVSPSPEFLVQRNDTSSRLVESILDVATAAFDSPLLVPAEQ